MFSEHDALEGAVTTMEADQIRLFEVLQRSASVDSMNEFESGKYLETMTSYVDIVFEDPVFEGLLGEPNKWLPDYEKSSTSALAVDGTSYDNGVVRLVACLEYRWTFAPESSSSPTIGDFAPLEMVVEYQPTKHAWLITDYEDLTDDPDAPTCPPVG